MESHARARVRAQQNNDRLYSYEEVFIRQRLGQQFTMDGTVLGKDGRISHMRFDFDAQTDNGFVHNQKLLSRFKEYYGGRNVELFSYKGECCVVCNGVAFDVTGMGTVEIIKASIKKCRTLATPMTMPTIPTIPMFLTFPMIPMIPIRRRADEAAEQRRIREEILARRERDDLEEALRLSALDAARDDERRRHEA